MASIDIYPTIDGSIKATSTTSWDATRDATSGTADDDESSDGLTPDAGKLTGVWFITRGFFTFAIPSSVGTITTATIRLTRKGNTPDGYFIASAKADATAIAGADFNNIDFSIIFN